MATAAKATPKKACSKCRTEKPATKDNFYANRQTPDGLAYQCKTCAAGYSNGTASLRSTPARAITVVHVAAQGMTVEEAEAALRFLVDKLKASEETLRPELDKRGRAIDSMALEIGTLRTNLEAKDIALEGLQERVAEQDELIEAADDEIKSIDETLKETRAKLEAAEAELEQYRRPVEFIEESLAQEVYALGFQGSRHRTSPTPR